MQEQWKPVNGYEGWYEVNQNGVIKRVRSGTGTQCKILKFYVDTKGYKSHTLTKSGIQRNHLTHRIVAKAFMQNPENKPCINHIDSNRLNSKVSNLEWCTYKENTQHCIVSGRFNSQAHSLKGEKNPKSIITTEQVREIRKSKLSLKELSVIYGLQWKYVSKVKNGGTWKHVT
jgi:hypothetical protein